MKEVDPPSASAVNAAYDFIRVLAEFYDKEVSVIVEVLFKMMLYLLPHSCSLLRMTWSLLQIVC
jgi:hypothetical protein